MGAHISMGFCRESDGSTTRSVFCNYCREVFALRVSFEESKDAMEKAQQNHRCEKFCDDHCTWLDHHADCRVIV